MSSSGKADVLVIGGGPAGLSSALMLGRLLRPVVLYDSGKYRNDPAAVSHTIITHEGAEPAKWREAARADLAKYKNVDVRMGKITQLKRLSQDDEPTLFEATDDKGNTLEVRKLVFATGIKDVLPDIPGLAEQWGRRAIHCIFCHGTESAGGAMGWLMGPGYRAPMNQAVVGAALKMWSAMRHSSKYVLTDGLDPSTEEGAAASGMDKYADVLKKKGFEVITDKIERIEDAPDAVIVHFAGGRTLSLPFLSVFPQRTQPHEHAAALLTEDIVGKLQCMGTIAGPPADAPPAHMPPRFAVDPRTPKRGVFWAGNAGSIGGNVNIAVGQGTAVAGIIADELGEDDLALEK